MVSLHSRPCPRPTTILSPHLSVPPPAPHLDDLCLSYTPPKRSSDSSSTPKTGASEIDASYHFQSAGILRNPSPEPHLLSPFKRKAGTQESTYGVVFMVQIHSGLGGWVKLIKRQQQQQHFSKENLAYKNTACPSCLRLPCTCLHVPCLRLCVCQSACVDRYSVSARACGACAGPLCANALHLLARAFPMPARVLCLHLVNILNYSEFPNSIDCCSSSG